GHKRARDVIIRQQRTDGNAVAQTFRQRDDVGRNAAPFVREELSGATDAALHFVEDEEYSVLVAQRADGAQVLIIGRTNAAFALNRFENDGRGLLVDDAGKRFDVVERNVVKTFRHRAKTFVIFRLSGRGQSAVSAAMKTIER